MRRSELRRLIQEELEKLTEGRFDFWKSRILTQLKRSGLPMDFSSYRLGSNDLENWFNSRKSVSDVVGILRKKAGR